MTKERVQNVLNVLEACGRIESQTRHGRVYYIYCKTMGFRLRHKRI